MTSTSKPKRVFDVELFESAAKAAGITLEWWDDGESLNPGYIVNSEGDWVSWDPVANDGDALRLAVRLHIDIQSYGESGNVHAYSKRLLGYGTDGVPSYQDRECMTEHLGDDPMAATRLAITRAAAEIGRRMES